MAPLSFASFHATGLLARLLTFSDLGFDASDVRGRKIGLLDKVKDEIFSVTIENRLKELSHSLAENLIAPYGRRVNKRLPLTVNLKGPFSASCFIMDIMVV